MIHYETNPAQKEDEFRRFLEIVERENIRNYLEIGVQRGITFRCVGMTMKPGGRLIGVDMPGGPWGVRDGSGPELIGKSCQDLEDRGQCVDMIWGNSRDERVIASARAACLRYDMVFIDGDHTYEGVKADWNNYGCLGRIVVFHDIDDTHNGIKQTSQGPMTYGVHKLWDELKVNHEHLEIFGEEPGMGIGILWRK